MSTSMPDYSRASKPATPKRVLACVLCQQRKVKCDRKFPCQNCTRLQAQCVPATLTPRRRRRKVAEQDLLDRLRRYEDLLRQNNVQFESIAHQSTVENESPGNMHDYDADEHQSAPTPSTVATARSEPSFEAKYVVSSKAYSMVPNILGIYSTPWARGLMIIATLPMMV